MAKRLRVALITIRLAVDLAKTESLAVLEMTY